MHGASTGLAAEGLKLVFSIFMRPVLPRGGESAPARKDTPAEGKSIE